MAERANALSPIVDLKAENRELDSLVSTLEAKDWARVTPFFDWTVRDQILHLYQVDRFGLISLDDRDRFVATVADVRAKQAEGIELSEQIRTEFAGLADGGVLATWRRGYLDVVDALNVVAEDYRVGWFGPDMGVRSFATARLMEVWAHGQDIYDLFGCRREPTDRIRHICDLGVRTFGWSYRNRGRDVPKRPDVSLISPTGQVWDWPGDGNGSVSGPAHAFALVVTQRRAPEDTPLTAVGDTASEWLSIAQCFAGAPQAPPAAGSRPALWFDD